MYPLIMIGIGCFVLLVFVITRRRRIDQVNENSNENESTQAISKAAQVYSSLKWLFIIIGVGSIINGLISAIGYFNTSQTVFQIEGATFNTSFGIINLICFWFFNNRKKIVIWVYGFSILLSISYSFAMGRGFNYPMSIIGGIIIYQLIYLSKENELIN